MRCGRPQDSRSEWLELHQTEETPTNPYLKLKRMATTSSPDETLLAYKASMGERLGAVYYTLYSELVFLHARWDQYRHLFGSGEEIVDLLNRHAPFFFRVVQDSLWEQTLLHIARLTDPVKTGKNENLSVHQMVELIEDEELKVTAHELAEICNAKAAFAREHRNKRLAHRDLQHALKESPEPLGRVSRAHVEEILAALVELMNLLEMHYRKATSIFRPFGSGGARTLILDLRSLERTKGN